MRIIAGRLRGKRLVTPPGEGTRPSPDRLREVLFQLLENRWGRPLNCPDALDLYAGCGSLALEAVSRGARGAVFVESNSRALAALRANIEAFENAADQGIRLELMPESVEKALDRLKEAGRRFTLILADPPYEAGYARWLLERAKERLADGGLLVLQHHENEAVPETAGGLTRRDQRKQGIHLLSFYTSS